MWTFLVVRKARSQKNLNKWEIEKDFLTTVATHSQEHNAIHRLGGNGSFHSRVKPPSSKFWLGMSWPVPVKSDATLQLIRNVSTRFLIIQMLEFANTMVLVQDTRYYQVCAHSLCKPGLLRNNKRKICENKFEISFCLIASMFTLLTFLAFHPIMSTRNNG